MKINYDLAQAYPVVPVTWIAINVYNVDNYYETIKARWAKKRKQNYRFFK